MALASAIAFLIFAVWAWREGTGDDNVSTTPESRFALLTVVSSFVLAEMSDKTSLATLTLASDHDWVGVWLGSTLGMVLADGLAIAIGTWLHQRLPTQLLHVLASLPCVRGVDPVRQRWAGARWPWWWSLPLLQRWRCRR